MSCSRSSLLVFVRVSCAYILVLRWHFGTKDLSGNFLSRPPTHPARKCAWVVPRFGTLRRYHAVVQAGCARSAGLGRFGDTTQGGTQVLVGC